MTRLNEKLRLARVVLGELERAGPLRWSELEKRTVKQCGTTGTFRAILRFLKSNRYVEKSGPSHRTLRDHGEENAHLGRHR